MLHWCHYRTGGFEAAEQTYGAIVERCIPDDQTLAVRDDMDAICNDVVHHPLNNCRGHANRIWWTRARVRLINPVPQDDRPHLA